MISGDAFNRQFHVCTVLALTTKVKPSQIAVTLPATVTGKVCQVLPWQIMTVSENRLDGWLCDLDSEYMRQVEHALHLVWRLA